MKFDLIIRGGNIIDPKNEVHGPRDLGIKGGKIVEVGTDLPGAQAREIWDLAGYSLMPGVIDTHTHVRGPAHRMMAKAGVCTCLDMGAGRSVFEEMPERGCGLNVAALQTIGPFADKTPSNGELDGLVEGALQAGAIGIKLVGGHRPSTPDATAAMIEAGNRAGAYVAFHVGSTETGSNLRGLLEAVQLAGKNHLHIAHVNSYLRGLIKDPVEEVVDGLASLKGKKNLVSESYLAIINGTGGKVVDGLPQSHVTRNCLRMRGYEPTEAGLEKAISDGYGLVQIEEGGETVMITGARGAKEWKAKGSDVGMSFPVNVPESTFLCAVKRDEKGKFIVDAISTDGGSIPRNVAVENGLTLVRYRALTLDEFVYKASTRGAQMLGLHAKGHLGEGADADITVLDMAHGRAAMTVVGGKMIMAFGIIYGKGGTVITTRKGLPVAKAVGLPAFEVNVQEMLLYTKTSE